MCTHILTYVYPHVTMYLQVKQHNNLYYYNKSNKKDEVITMKTNTNINEVIKELKEFQDIYKEYTKPTSSMRFTLN